VRNVRLPHATLVAETGVSLAGTEGFTFSGVPIKAARGPAYVLEKTRGLTVERGVVAPGTDTFVSVTDEATSGVRILVTDLKGVAKPVALAAGARPGAAQVK
jgi:hypothetical protein